jgi:hypothetical protein
MRIWRGSINLNGFIGLLIKIRLRMDALEGVKPARSKRGHSLFRFYPLKGSVRGLCTLKVAPKPELREI